MLRNVGVLLATLVTSNAVWAVDTGAVVGGALGGATGAVIGQQVGGKNGAIIGAAIGGATGAAMGSSSKVQAAPAPTQQASIPQEAATQVSSAQESDDDEIKHGRGHAYGHDKEHHKKNKHDHDD